MLYKKTFPKNFTNFTRKHLCWGSFLSTCRPIAATLLREKFRLRFFPVNFVKFLRKLVNGWFWTLRSVLGIIIPTKYNKTFCPWNLIHMKYFWNHHPRNFSNVRKQRKIFEIWQWITKRTQQWCLIFRVSFLSLNIKTK